MECILNTHKDPLAERGLPLLLYQPTRLLETEIGIEKEIVLGTGTKIAMRLVTG